jgi:hypothetical protein
MADFNFGKVGSALEAGQIAKGNIDMGPISFDAQFFDIANMSNFADHDIFAKRTSNYENEFIWGQKWGSKSLKVSK